MVETSRIEKPARRLLIRRGVSAEDYFAFCEEVGCDTFDQTWAFFENHPDALGEPMGLWLPDRLIASETSRYVIGVELPADFAGELPDGVDQVLLPPTTYIMFHAPPGDAMFVEVKQAVKAFEAEWDTTTAPVFQYAPDDVRGYVEGLPLAQLGAQSA